MLIMDTAQQLQNLCAGGFELQTFDRYPNAIGVIRGNCIALFQSSANGLQMIGTPGWRMGGVLGVLTTRSGEPVFQAKSEIVAATAERVAELNRFRDDLEAFLAAQH